ncbi:hypothetical protein ACG2LH_01985 [Zhouia sp. PK063]|uniref:hypothetical protein n=1 Tax=Zhouia sp. PK063 TaxID=3373602 RepID=UPI0037ADC89D
MRIFKLTLSILLVISCKQKKQEIEPELKKENQKSEIITEEEQMKTVMDSIYEIYKKGKVEKFDWDLVFNKADVYRKISETYSDKKLIPKDFLEFSQKFISDSEFQKAHIDFENLIAVVGACEETYVLKEDNWVVDDWNFISEIGIDKEWENTFHFSDNIFFSEYKLKEVGTLRMLGFEKINGKWNLTLLFQNDC